jgi:hypothetical protein
MNTSTADTVVVELAEEYKPAELLNSWAKRVSETD